MSDWEEGVKERRDSLLREVFLGKPKKRSSEERVQSGGTAQGRGWSRVTGKFLSKDLMEAFRGELRK